MIASRLPARSAQWWHLATAVVVVVGLVWQLELIVRGVDVLVDSEGRVPGLGTRIVRFFSYFTVQSNLLVAGTAIALARDPERDGRVWRVLRLEALFGITVTGVIYSTLLHRIVELHGAAAITNALLHYVAPIMAVLGWLWFGPRPRITDDVLVASLIWPGLYVAYVLLFGAASGWYPYPFVDVGDLGYATTIRNGVGVNVLLIGVGALYLWLDRRLPRTARAAVSGRA